MVLPALYRNEANYPQQVTPPCKFGMCIGIDRVAAQKVRYRVRHFGGISDAPVPVLLLVVKSRVLPVVVVVLACVAREFWAFAFWAAPKTQNFAGPHKGLRSEWRPSSASIGIYLLGLTGFSKYCLPFIFIIQYFGRALAAGTSYGFVAACSYPRVP
jgi:hypothetical protein